MSRVCWVAAIMLGTTTIALADPRPSAVKIDARVSVVFGNRAEAAGVLSGSDEFIRSMSAFDRSARMHQAKVPNERELRAYLGGQALDWSADDARRLASIATGLAPSLKSFARWLPDRVLLVKSTNLVEDGAAHTRETAIVLPEASLQIDDRGLERQLVHEMFHLITRSHPVMRDQLYGLIGFSPCRPLSIPGAMRDGLVTNPDAPRAEHAIRVQRLGRSVSVVPVLQARPPVYDPNAGKSLFQYVSLRFLLVEQSPTECRAGVQGGQGQTFGLEELSGFFDQVGRNTEYVIHPEEILADNFVIAVLGADRAPTPLIPKKIKAALAP